LLACLWIFWPPAPRLISTILYIARPIKSVLHGTIYKEVPIVQITQFFHRYMIVSNSVLRYIVIKSAYVVVNWIEKWGKNSIIFIYFLFVDMIWLILENNIDILLYTILFINSYKMQAMFSTYEKLSVIYITYVY